MILRRIFSDISLQLRSLRQPWLGNRHSGDLFVSVFRFRSVSFCVSQLLHMLHATCHMPHTHTPPHTYATMWKAPLCQLQLAHLILGASHSTVFPIFHTPPLLPKSLQSSRSSVLAAAFSIIANCPASSRVLVMTTEGVPQAFPHFPANQFASSSPPVIRCFRACSKYFPVWILLLTGPRSSADFFG